MSETLNGHSSIRNETHYYSDGDVIINVELMDFQVHKNILSLASTVFNDMFANAKPANFQDIPKITLESESATAFESLLSFIYPTVYINVKWDNIVEIIRISDKFIVITAFTTAKFFLTEKFQENPLLALYLSEKYRFKELFKEASKLVLDNFYEYKKNSIFAALSVNTKLALIEKHHNYLTALWLLNEDQLNANKRRSSDEVEEIIKLLDKTKKVRIPAPIRLFVHLNQMRLVFHFYIQFQIDSKKSLAYSNH